MINQDSYTPVIIGEWISRAELSQLLSVPFTTVRQWSERQCWKVRYHKSPSGREVQVHIASLPDDLRARLAGALFDKRLSSPLEHLTPEQAEEWGNAAPDQRSRALAKIEVLRHWQQATLTAQHGDKVSATQDFLKWFFRSPQGQEALEALGRPRSVRTLYDWRQFFEAKGIIGLLDRYGRPPGKGGTPQEIRDFIKNCLIANPRINAAHIRRLIPAKFPNLPVPGASTVRLHVMRYRREHAESLELIHQPSQHKRHYQPSLGRADAGVRKPNQRWEADSTRADIMARPHRKVIEIVTQGGKRYTLIAVVDVHSRRPVALLEEKGGGYNINLCLMKAVKRLGLPDTLIVDLGKDYRSAAVKGFCRNLSIDMPLIPGRTPEAKPHVERFFDTIQSDLFALLPGYTANKLANRSEIILAKYSREQLQSEIDRWIAAYEGRVHGSTGQTPLERGNPEGWSKRTVSEAILRMLLNPPVERSVRQCFVRHNGGRFWLPEFKDMEGSAKVLVCEDPDDAGILHVYDKSTKFIGLAQDLNRQGLKPEHINAERRAWKKVRQLWQKEAQATDKALNLAALNRKALDLEIASAPPVTEAPTVEVDIPHLREAAEAKENYRPPEQLPEAMDLLGGLDAFLEDEGQAPPEQDAPEAATVDPANPLPRPEWFLDAEHRFRWTRKRQYHGLPVNAEDLEVAAEFEGSWLYKSMSPEYWERDARSLELSD